MQTPEESENPETAVESEEPDNLGDSEKPEDVKLEPGWNFIDGKNITQMRMEKSRQAG